MASDAAGAARLLYVSNLEDFDVYVYRFPSLELAGRLTGFDNPEGECTDAAGDVWIANTSGENMLEYAHGGKAPIANLSDPTGYPVGCAINPLDGDLAVTNLYGFSGAGGVLVYERARGTPRVYANPKQYYYYFDAYDRHGNLYVSGETFQKAYRLSVLPHAARVMSFVAIHGGTLYLAGTVAWNGSTLVLGDQRCKQRSTSCLYRAKVSGKSASITGVTPLRGSCDVAQAWVGTSEIAGGDNASSCIHARSSVDLWPFPKGGAPEGRATGPRFPVGAAVSSRSAR
jgi:hypothetical protein